MTYVLWQTDVHMEGKQIQWSHTVIYKRYEIYYWERDSSELIRQKREIYMQANIILSRFRSCIAIAKKLIFTTKFNNIYCATLWTPVKAGLLNPIKVAKNDCLRKLFGFSIRCSASAMFARQCACDLYAIRRRVCFSLLSQLSTTSNSILFTC